MQGHGWTCWKGGQERQRPQMWMAVTSVDKHNFILFSQTTNSRLKWAWTHLHMWSFKHKKEQKKVEEDDTMKLWNRVNFVSPGEQFKEICMCVPPQLARMSALSSNRVSKLKLQLHSLSLIYFFLRTYLVVCLVIFQMSDMCRGLKKQCLKWFRQSLRHTTRGRRFLLPVWAFFSHVIVFPGPKRASPATR